MASIVNAARPLSIGEVATAAGVNPQTLRYYERVGLLPAARRSRAGYRQYTDESVRVLSFVKRAQELGFTLREIKELLALRRAGSQRRDAVRAVATAKVADIEQRIQDLIAIRGALSSLLDSCACQRSKPECPILEALEKKSAEGS